MTTLVLPTQAAPAVSQTVEPTVDQKLCAAAYVCDGLADYVFWSFHEGRPAAWAPSCTIDAIALLRHAAAARRVRRLRDGTLLMLALAVPAVLVIHLALRFGGAAAAVVAVIIAASWAGHSRLSTWLAAGWAKIWTGPPDGRWKAARRGLGVLATLAMLTILAAQDPLFWICLGTGVAAVALGAAAVIGGQVWAQHHARAVLDSPAELRALAAALPSAVEGRLTRQQDMNVVVYHSERTETPFVGNGYQVELRKIEVDVSRGATGEDGKKRMPKEFNIADLHQALRDQFQIEAAVKATPSREFRAGHRLYVDGSKILWDSPLLAGEPPLPRERMAWEDLVSELRQPDYTDMDHRRVYFYVEEVGRRGQIAVAVFVRPYQHDAHLYIEVIPHVMLPISESVEVTVTHVPKRAIDQWTRAVRTQLPATLRLLIDSPSLCGQPVGARLRVCRWRWAWRRAARGHQVYDFGAVISVREGVSLLEPKRLGLFENADLDRILSYLQGRVIASIRAFLNKHDIDTAMLDDSARRLVQHVKVGDIRAGTVSFGDSNTFNPPPPHRDKDEDGRSEQR